MGWPWKVFASAMEIPIRSKTFFSRSKRNVPTFVCTDSCIKLEALKSATVRELLHSSDSMAWSFAGRKSGTEHDPRLALAYATKIEALIGEPSFIQPQLFQWVKFQQRYQTRHGHFAYPL